jgi:hypothetical protein
VSLTFFRAPHRLPNNPRENVLAAMSKSRGSRVVPTGGNTMQYLLLIYEDEKRFSTLDKAAFEKEIGEYRAFGAAHAAAIKGGNALQPTGTAGNVRVRNGKPIVTDGPFAETKEQLGGFYLVEAKDRQEALAIGAKIPGARYGTIEARPIMTFS